jgi:hypothetical protein
MLDVEERVKEKKQCHGSEWRKEIEDYAKEAGHGNA